MLCHSEARGDCAGAGGRSSCRVRSRRSTVGPCSYCWRQSCKAQVPSRQLLRRRKVPRSCPHSLPPPPCPNATTSLAQLSQTAAEEAVLCLVNRERGMLVLRAQRSALTKGLGRRRSVRLRTPRGSSGGRRTEDQPSTIILRGETSRPASKRQAIAVSTRTRPQMRTAITASI